VYVTGGRTLAACAVRSIVCAFVTVPSFMAVPSRSSLLWVVVVVVVVVAAVVVVVVVVVPTPSLRYVRKVAEVATQMFIAGDRPTVKGIVLAGGGHSLAKAHTRVPARPLLPTAPALLNSPFVC
jgi:hypothetical protein